MMNWLARLRAWVIRIGHWLGEPWRAWVAVVTIPGLLLLSALILHQWEQRLRITGMVLELLGVVTVAIGLRGVRQLFGRPSLSQLFVDWVKQFPKFKTETRMMPARHIRARARVLYRRSGPTHRLQARPLSRE